MRLDSSQLRFPSFRQRRSSFLAREVRETRRSNSKSNDELRTTQATTPARAVSSLARLTPAHDTSFLSAWPWPTKVPTTMRRVSPNLPRCNPRRSRTEETHSVPLFPEGIKTVSTKLLSESFSNHLMVPSFEIFFFCYICSVKIEVFFYVVF